MTDLEMTKLCAEAMGWKYLGAVGVDLPKGIRGSEADRIYPGKLWCLSGGNDWWRDPEGNSVCGVCQSIPDPLHDDAQAMALVKKFNLCINRHNEGDYLNWLVSGFGYYRMAHSENPDDLNRAIVECVAKMQLAKVSPAPKS